MKTARFTNVVEKAGDPEPHLVLTKPEQDSELRKAIKANRVMTMFQEAVGQKADRGNVGFDLGINRQSLRAFKGKEIVGIKYDFIKAKEIPKSQRATPPKPPGPPPKKKKAIKTEEKIEPVEELRGEEQQDEGVAAIKNRSDTR